MNFLLMNYCSQKLLLNMLDNHCIHCNEQIANGDDQPLSSYDFLYLPIDFKWFPFTLPSFISFLSFFNCARLGFFGIQVKANAQDNWVSYTQVLVLYHCWIFLFLKTATNAMWDMGSWTWHPRRQHGGSTRPFIINIGRSSALGKSVQWLMLEFRYFLFSLSKSLKLEQYWSMYCFVLIVLYYGSKKNKIRTNDERDWKRWRSTLRTQSSHARWTTICQLFSLLLETGGNRRSLFPLLATSTINSPSILFLVTPSRAPTMR